MRGPQPLEQCGRVIGDPNPRDLRAPMNLGEGPARQLGDAQRGLPLRLETHLEAQVDVASENALLAFFQVPMLA